MDRHPGGPDLRLAFAVARLGGSLCVRGFAGEVREGLRGGVDEGDEPGPLRSEVSELIPILESLDSRGIPKSAAKMFQTGKRRRFCHGPSDRGERRLYERPGSPVCQAGKGWRASAQTFGDRGGTRWGVTGRSGAGWWHGPADAA